MRSRRLAIAAAMLALLCAAAVAMAIGGRGRERTPVGPHPTFLLAWDLTSLSAGACTLPPGLSFSRALGTAASETVQTGTSTVVTSGLGANQPRCGRRLDADSVGLVIEETRTNAHPYSRDLNNAAMGAGSGLTFTGGQVGPDGATNAARVVVTSAGYSAYFNGGSLIGQTRVLSAWEAAGPGSGVFQFYQEDNAGGAGRAATGAGAAAWGRVATAAYTFVGGTGYVLSQYSASLDLTAIGGTTAGARDSLVDMLQWETGKFATEFIRSNGAPATRAGERLYLASAATVIPAGRLSLAVSLRPKAAPASYSAAMRVWTSGADYAEIATTGVLTVSIGGVTNTTAALTWSQYDVLDLWIAAGGGQSTLVSYRVNAGATAHPTVTGSALGSVSMAGALDLLCSGTASQLSAWVYSLTFWKSGGKPAWA